MDTFLCANGMLVRCDAPKVGGHYQDIARHFGFEVRDTMLGANQVNEGLVCRPQHGQEVYLSVHGQDRLIYALVIWHHDPGMTLIFVTTPFDLVTAVEQISRYQRALYEAGHYAQLRASGAQELAL